jgi:hypothetical protein
MAYVAKWPMQRFDQTQGVVLLATKNEGGRK